MRLSPSNRISRKGHGKRGNSSRRRIADPIAQVRPSGLHSFLSTTLLIFAVTILLVDSLILMGTDDTASVARNLVLQVVLLVVFWWWSALNAGTLLNAPFVFVLALFFWHSSFLAGKYFHLSDEFSYSAGIFTYGEEFVPDAVALVSLCMALSVVGSVFACWQRFEQRKVDRRMVREWKLSPQTVFGTPGAAVRRFALLMFGGYVALTLLYIFKEGGGASSQSYSDLYAQASGSILYRLYQMTKFLGVPLIGLVFATSKTKTSRLMAYAGTLVLIFVSALTGARSMPFLYCTVLLISVDHFRKRIPLPAIIGAAFAGAAASWIIVQGRAVGVGLKMFETGLEGHPISFWHLFWTAGGTFGALLRTMAFSAGKTLAYGRTFAEAFVFVVPGPIVSLFAPRWTVLTPSVWIIKESPHAVAGEGLGFSLVAEAFLNFGMWGCLLFLVVGWLIAYQYFGLRSRGDVFAVLQSFNLSILLALHLRNDSVTYVRVLIWGVLLLYVARQVDLASKRRAIATPKRTSSASTRNNAFTTTSPNSSNQMSA